MQADLQIHTAAAELAGDLRPLIEQLGSPEGFARWADAGLAALSTPVRNSRQLRQFLASYHERILIPFELPAINRAFCHACRHELRELIAFDAGLANETSLQGFAGASRLAGRNQLGRLRPLRDDRFVQRYMMAVDNGSAQGWHTLVYGLTLSVYSRPLRQGLLAYARQTTAGFIDSVSGRIELAPSDARELFDELTAPLAKAIEPLLDSSSLIVS